MQSVTVVFQYLVWVQKDEESGLNIFLIIAMFFFIIAKNWENKTECASARIWLINNDISFHIRENYKKSREGSYLCIWNDCYTILSEKK